MRPDRLGWLLVALGACAPPADPVEVIDTWGCDDPGETVRFDTLTLPGDPAASHRFAGAGVGVGDLDGDGRLDVVAPGPLRLRVWRQGGPREAPTFTAQPLDSAIEALGADATAVALADVDRDGDLDVFVSRFGPGDALLLGDGAGGFVLSDDPEIGRAGHSQSAAIVDLDLDGALDVVVAGHGPVEAENGQTAIDGPGDPTRLLHQVPGGPLRFEDRSALVAEGAQAAYTFVATPFHLDRDGQIDILLANDFPVYRPTQALRQSSAGFALVPDAGLSVRAAGMGVAAHDVNRDGWDDFVLPVWNRIVYLQSVDGDPPRWVEAQAAAGLAIDAASPAHIGWGADFGDLDADGLADVVVGFGHLDTVGVRTAGGASADNALEQPDRAFVARPDGTFAPAPWPLDHPGVTRGVLLVDLDGNGWLDVVRRDLEGPIRVDLARCGPHHTLVVEPFPPADAVGAVVTVWVDDELQTRTIRAGGTSLGSGGPPEAHFGLGEATEVSAVSVSWPDGSVTERRGPWSADQRVRIAR